MLETYSLLAAVVIILSELKLLVIAFFAIFLKLSFADLPLIICPISCEITAATSVSVPAYVKSVLEIWTILVVEVLVLSAAPFTTLNVVLAGRLFFVIIV